MLRKLQAVESRYEELCAKSEQPDFYADPQKAAKLLREKNDLEPIVECYRAYNAAQRDMEDAQELMADPEMKELCQETYLAAKEEKAKLYEQLRILLLPKDPNDSRNVIMELRAGTGGEEAALFAGDLYRMYTMYAQTKGWKMDLVSLNETELGGVKECSVLIEGEGAYSRLKFESGVHRVQRVPVTESSGRIQTSAATVAVLPEAEDVECEIDPKDLQIDTYRASGAGGQHVNKTESAIRITHLPTGLVVECQDERSQYKNKDKALKVLKSRLLQEKQDEQAGSIAAERKSQVGTGDRSERIRTYNYHENRITDHRIGLTIYKLSEVLGGNLDQLIDPLIAADRAEKLKESMDNQ